MHLCALLFLLNLAFALCAPSGRFAKTKLEDTWKSIQLQLAESESTKSTPELIEALLSSLSCNVMTHNSHMTPLIVLERMEFKSINSSHLEKITQLIQVWYFCLLSLIFNVRGLAVNRPWIGAASGREDHFAILCEHSLLFRQKVQGLKAKVSASIVEGEPECALYVQMIDEAVRGIERFPASYDALFVGGYWGTANKMWMQFTKRKFCLLEKSILEHVEFWSSFLEWDGVENCIPHPGNDIWPKSLTSWSVSLLLCSWEALVERLQVLGIDLEPADEFECLVCKHSPSPSAYSFKLVCRECTKKHEFHPQCIPKSECADCANAFKAYGSLPLACWLDKFESFLRKVLVEAEQLEYHSKNLYISYDHFLEDAISMNSANSKRHQMLLKYLNSGQVPLAKEILIPIAERIIRCECNVHVNVLSLNLYNGVQHYAPKEMQMLHELHASMSIGPMKDFSFLCICDCFALLNQLFRIVEQKYDQLLFKRRKRTAIMKLTKEHANSIATTVYRQQQADPEESAKAQNTNQFSQNILVGLRERIFILSVLLAYNQSTQQIQELDLQRIVSIFRMCLETVSLKHGARQALLNAAEEQANNEYLPFALDFYNQHVAQELDKIAPQLLQQMQKIMDSCCVAGPDEGKGSRVWNLFVQKINSKSLLKFWLSNDNLITFDIAFLSEEK